MPGAIECMDPNDVVRALGTVDPARTEAAREAADRRPIEYPLGSGEADEVALFAGLKPVIRQVLPPTAVGRARAKFERLGLAVVDATHRTPVPSADGAVLYVGRDRARTVEAGRLEGEEEHDVELGRLLGYPACCVDAYVELPPPRRNVDAFAAAFRRSGGSFEPRLNTLDLAVFHYVSWLPCSFACPLSKRFADAVATHIAKRHGQFLASPSAAVVASCPPGCRHERFVAAIDRALGAHRLVVLEDVQVSIDGVFEAGKLHVRRAWPTARDRHPAAALSAASREAVARLVAAVEAGGTLSARDGVLFVRDEPILRAGDVLLAPFGATVPGPA